jgi:hypothetical protein
LPAQQEGKFVFCLSKPYLQPSDHRAPRNPPWQGAVRLRAPYVPPPTCITANTAGVHLDDESPTLHIPPSYCVSIFLVSSAYRIWKQGGVFVPFPHDKAAFSKGEQSGGPEPHNLGEDSICRCVTGRRAAGRIFGCGAPIQYST